MTPDGLVVEETAAGGTRRRVTRTKDPNGGWTRHEEERVEGGWRTVGVDPVTDLEVEGQLDSGEGEGVTNAGP